MTPQEFHEACLETLSECPQFRGYDEDMYFEGYGEFGSIPRKGWIKTIKFWREENLLWDMGYHEALPEEILKIFDCVEKALERAILEAVKENGK